jgi:acyl-CoA thioesterase-1
MMNIRSPFAFNPMNLVVVLAFVLAIAGCGGSTVKLPKLAGDAVVLAFGDSLTFGTGTTPDKSYPAALERKIGRKVIAAGIPGEVSAAGLARLPGVLDEVKPRLLILCHGGNDMLRKMSTKQAADNIRAMVALARSRGMEVMLLGVPSPGLFLSTADHYDEIARELKLPYEGKAIANILSDSALKADTIHPNAEGYQRLADAVADVLKKSGAL